MSSANNHVSWTFNRQISGRARMDIMSTFEVELTLSSNIEAEIMDIRMAIPDNDPINLAKPCITLMSITCPGHSKLEATLLRFMDTHYADFKISFDTKNITPNGDEAFDYHLLPHNMWVIFQFQSLLFHELACEDFEIDTKFRPGRWMPSCPLALKLPIDRDHGMVKYPIQGSAVGVRLIQVLPAPKVILTINSKMRVEPPYISGANYYAEQTTHFAHCDLCGHGSRKLLTRRERQSGR